MHLSAQIVQDEYQVLEWVVQQFKSPTAQHGNNEPGYTCCSQPFVAQEAPYTCGTVDMLLLTTRYGLSKMYFKDVLEMHNDQIKPWGA